MYESNSNNYSIQRPVIFLIIKNGNRFKWQLWRDRNILCESNDNYATASTARRAVERLIDCIRRNAVSPRIIEAKP